MNFPLIPVPPQLAAVLPMFFSPAQHQFAALLGTILCIVSGMGTLMPAVLNGQPTETNRSFATVGIILLFIAALFAIFGGYAAVVAIVLFCGFLIWALLFRLPKIFKK